MAQTDWRDVECDIEVCGKPIPTYPPAKQDAILDRYRLSYVETVDNADFMICFKMPAGFRRYAADQVRFTLWIDGKGLVNRKRGLGSTGALLKVNVGHVHSYDAEKKKDVDYPLKFAPIVISELNSTAAEANHIKVEDLGSIRLELRRAIKVKKIKKPKKLADLPLSTIVAETVLKGVDVSSMITLGTAIPPKKARQYTKSSSLPGIEGASWTFEFRYRTRSQLQVLGCIPPDLRGPGVIEIVDDKDASKASLKIDQSIGNMIESLKVSQEPPLVISHAVIKQEPLSRPHTSYIGLSGRTDNQAGALREELEQVDRELALLQRRKHIKTIIVALSPAAGSSFATDVLVKADHTAVTHVKRENDGPPSAIRIKRSKPEFVDLSED